MLRHPVLREEKSINFIRDYLHENPGFLEEFRQFYDEYPELNEVFPIGGF